MDNFARQKQEELTVFKNFIRICDYPIVETNIIQQDPPKPDIFCKLQNGNSVEFELINAIDYQLAQKMNDKKILDKGGFCGNPIEMIILDKNNKLREGKYVLSADCFDLLVYLGLMPLFPHWNNTMPSFLETNKKKWIFNRIWIFQDDQSSPRILWSYPKHVELL